MKILVQSIKVLLLDDGNVYYKTLENYFANQNIELIHTRSITDANKIIANDNSLFLIIAFCKSNDLLPFIQIAKTQDIFRPIIVVGNKSCTLKMDVIQMGVNIFYEEPLNIEQLVIQSFNLITLYRSKKYSKSQNDVFKTLSMALDIRDPYTHGHGERVAIYSTILYDELGFKDYEIREAIRVGCIIHDVGKIGTPDNILKSNSKLSEKEFQTIQSHPTDGVRICSRLVSDPLVIDIIEHHHEKLDGSGYPYGLKRNQISESVQIATIADTYDALTSDRLYRIKNTPEEALFVMNKHFLEEDKINREFFKKFVELISKNAFEEVSFII